MWKQRMVGYSSGRPSARPTRCFFMSRQYVSICREQNVRRTAKRFNRPKSSILTEWLIPNRLNLSGRERQSGIDGELITTASCSPTLAGGLQRGETPQGETPRRRYLAKASAVGG